MIVLGIETSCDETSVAVVEASIGAGILPADPQAILRQAQEPAPIHVLSNVISSSRKTFEALAGVIPEQAARMQIECMIPVLEKALHDAHVTWTDIDAIAVTRGPGLLGSLLVGTVTARALASIHKKPLIGVHHTLGHLSSTWLQNAPHPFSHSTISPSNHPTIQPSFPLLTLSASGGHTDLWYRESHTRGKLLGRTRDDAAGEAFDKGASMLGLPYPGGPSIQKAAQNGNPHAFPFPLPLHNEDTLDFSFSGLKTSLKYLLRDNHFTIQPSHHLTISQSSPPSVRGLAASFQHAICAHLLDRVTRALTQHPDVKEFHIVGGVSANTHLRELASALCEENGVTLRVPQSLAYCTDNAAMIAAAGYFLHEELGSKAFTAFETTASVPLDMAIRA